MGCGASKTAAVAPNPPARAGHDEKSCKPNTKDQLPSGKEEHKDSRGSDEQTQTTSADDLSINRDKVPAINRIHVKDPNPEPRVVASHPRSIAFDVQLGGENTISKEFPALSNFKAPRRLEALKNAPKLTAEELAQKMAFVETKRNMLLEKRRRKATSKLKNGSNSKINERSEEKARKLEDKLRIGQEKREQLRLERVKKQQRRREHEEKVREKARHLKDDENIGLQQNNELETYQDSGDEHTWDDMMTERTSMKTGIEETETPRVTKEKETGESLDYDFFEK